MIKVGNQEGTSMNESAKIRNMTEREGQAYSGCWQLPSGKPGLGAYIPSNEIEVILCGSPEDDLQMLLTTEDGADFFKNYKWDKSSEATAVKEFNAVVKALDNEFVDPSKVAKKFGLHSM